MPKHRPFVDVRLRYSARVYIDSVKVRAIAGAIHAHAANTYNGKMTYTDGSPVYVWIVDVCSRCAASEVTLSTISLYVHVPDSYIWFSLDV